MIDFSKAFPERTAANIERVRRQDAALIARDPFGGALEKVIHHHFEDGDRVEVDAPNHRAHGHKGVIKDDRSDSHLMVLLDSGHTIYCHAGDLKPENFSEAGDEAVTRIAKSRAADARNPMAVEDDVLIKRTKGADFKVGDRVKDGAGWIGKITKINPAGLAEVAYENGMTATCAIGYLKAVA
jgi:hypothetical protein